MLSLIEIKPGEAHAYKQPDSPIEPGRYFKFGGFLPKNPEGEAKKKILELKAVELKGRFTWIAPCEPWVKRIQDGQLFSEPTLNEEPRWDLIGIDPNILRSWQREFAKEVWNYLRQGVFYGKGWIARVGAGKTLAGLTIMQLFEPSECLVIVERYLWETWRSQAAEWGFPIPALSTAESAHKIPAGKIKCLVVDEALRLKNPLAQRSQHVERIARECELVVGFTGIPTGGGGPLDFRWLRVINPGCVPKSPLAWQFKFGLDTQLKDVGPNKAYITTQYDRAAIAQFISPYIHTVDPEEIIRELPEIQFHFIECDAPKQYDLIKQGGATCSGTHKRLAQTMQATDGFVYDDQDKPIRFASPKLDIVQKLVEDIGEPVILVTAWSDAVDQLRNLFASEMPSVVEGGAAFDTEISRFKSGLTRILIANAGFSKGMNLQSVCSNIIFLSTSTKPDDYEQMLGRVHRPGQKNGVNIFHICCKDTLDRRRVELVQAHKGCSEDFVLKLLLEELEK